MNITKEWLKEQSACSDGYGWFISQKETNTVKVLKKLIKENRLDWVNWTICRIFNRKQRIQYAVYAAEQVIEIYEKKYPDDKRPREAIEAAKKCIENDTEGNRNAAHAAYAAYAAYDAHVAYAAAHAAHVAYAAAHAAYAASYVAYAAAHAAYDAHVAYADDTAASYAASYDAMKKKILEYGIKLLKEGK